MAAAPDYMMPGPIGDRKVYLVSKHERDKPGHRALEISVSLQDSVHWFSYEGQFKVLGLEAVRKDSPDPKSLASKEELANAPAPFYRKFPEDNSQYAFQISSGPARPQAIGYTYKASFEFEDRTQVDPHIHIG